MLTWFIIVTRCCDICHVLQRLFESYNNQHSVYFGRVRVFLLLISNDHVVLAVKEFTPAAICCRTDPSTNYFQPQTDVDGFCKHAPRSEDPKPVNSFYISWLEASRQHQDRDPGGESRSSATISLITFELALKILLRAMTGYFKKLRF